MSLFTPEELAELQRFDSELDAEFRQTQEEIEESRKRDRRVGFERKDNRGRKIAAQKAAYREANKENITPTCGNTCASIGQRKKPPPVGRPESGKHKLVRG